MHQLLTETCDLLEADISWIFFFSRNKMLLSLSDDDDGEDGLMYSTKR